MVSLSVRRIRSRRITEFQYIQHTTISLSWANGEPSKENLQHKMLLQKKTHFEIRGLGTREGYDSTSLVQREHKRPETSSLDEFRCRFFLLVVFMLNISLLGSPFK